MMPVLSTKTLPKEAFCGKLETKGLDKHWVLTVYDRNGVALGRFRTDDEGTYFYRDPWAKKEGPGICILFDHPDNEPGKAVLLDWRGLIRITDI